MNMNEIRKSIAQARRRMWLAMFGDNLLVFSIVGLAVCLVALAVPRIWPLAFLAEDANAQWWNWGWPVGCTVVALCLALLRTALKGPRMFDAAVEVDSRFRLKERLSSLLSLPPQDLDSPSGKALLQDAMRKSEVLEIGDKFRFQFRRLAVVPVVMLLAVAGMFFLKVAVAEDPVQADDRLTQSQKEEIKKAIEITKQELQQKLEEFKDPDLGELDPQMKAISQKLDNLRPEDLSKKEAMIQLNDIQKEIEAKKDDLGDVQSLKKKFDKLNESNSGMARDFSKALKDGDVDKARKLIDDLAQKIKDGSLSEREQNQVAKDLSKLADKMAEMAAAHEKKKEDLQRQIQQAADKGDQQKAAELQQKLDELEKSDRQNEQMKKMADSLGQCAQCMGQSNPNKQGNQGQSSQGQEGGQQDPSQQGEGSSQKQSSAEQAQGGQQGGSSGSGMSQEELDQALQQMSEQLQQMQNDMQQMETLDDLSNQMSQCKGMCNGNSMSSEPGNNPFSQGRGPGGGERGKSETDTAFFRSKVDADPQDGETVVTGKVDGPNKSGTSVAEVREQVAEEMNREYDPLENQRLPRRTQEHVLEYFKRLRGEDGGGN